MYTANVIRTLCGREDIALTVMALGTATSAQNSPAGAVWHVFSPPRGSGMARGLIGKYPRSTAATISRSLPAASPEAPYRSDVGRRHDRLHSCRLASE